jgi:hypothetical protein
VTGFGSNFLFPKNGRVLRESSSERNQIAVSFMSRPATGNGEEKATQNRSAIFIVVQTHL